ncbi:MAG: flagellar basal body-associated FliL family protein [Clostridiaceae bacterium]|nr:flagellar basal body-associated FliL family protein [Clostridiaceae bacterium]
MQGKTLYTILLSIIAVLTLALAVMVIFIFTAFNGAKAKPEEGEEIEKVERAVPQDEQAEYKLYSEESGEGIFNIKASEDHPNSFLMTSVSIIYDGGKKNRKLEKRKELLEKNDSLLKQATIKYFLSKSFEELSENNAMEEARKALKDAFNEIVSKDSEELIIIDVVIVKWMKQ